MMTLFVRDDFNYHGGYLTYHRLGYENLWADKDHPGYAKRPDFVARFKYAKDSRGPFTTFLIKNFTQEEYFDRLDAGESPLDILRSKGFIQSHVKKWLKQGGYPVTVAGYAQYQADQSAVGE
jgi:hypothetical protein